MRVLICDDHVMFADALAALVRARSHEAVTASEPGLATALIRTEAFDVCLMDLTYPTPGAGLDAVRQICTEGHGPPVLVLSASEDPLDIGRAREAGACGFVSKMQRADFIVGLIERAPSMTEYFADVCASTPRAMTPGSTQPSSHLRLASLTPREREVLYRLVQGESTRSLASGMGVRYATARSHIQRVLTKLGVRSRVEAVAFAAQAGLVPASVGDGEERVGRPSSGSDAASAGRVGPGRRHPRSSPGPHLTRQAG